MNLNSHSDNQSAGNSTNTDSANTHDSGVSAPGMNFPREEERLMERWRLGDIYHKTLRQRRKANKGTFVFYEGPPTANGLPHPGHCLTRAIKDLYPRYKTMQGFLCERMAGWDTHGLPVEVEVCKELGIHSKEDIEQFGIEPFIHRCIENVFRYTKQWEELTERVGFWIDLDRAYVTYHKSYVESVWWALKTFFDRGLLYQGHKIVWWWAQGGTALSAGEVGQGYRQVADPAVFVRFPLLNDPVDDDANQPLLKDVDLLVWTTTPWTLPSNQFAAVHPELDYSVVSFTDPDGKELDESRKVIIASALVETIAAKLKKKAVVAGTITGKQLVGRRYIPPFDCYYREMGETLGTLRETLHCGATQQHLAWRVCGADFVTTDSGTGLVHQAPAFGEVDFEILVAQQQRFQTEEPQLICAVAPNGTFTADFPEFQGRWVKECDREIIKLLKEKGILFFQEQYLHDYPFCWRASNDPLIQYPRRSWFIKTSQFVPQMLENNGEIGWYPDHIQTGRFGNFLAGNIDWALSRERFWGTPLPIWVCEETGYQEAVSNYEELLVKPGISGTEVWNVARDKAKEESQGKWSTKDDETWEHLKVHKPYIDAITYDSPKKPGAKMRRVSEVIDCWFDSGAMPFAQFGYPNKPGSESLFETNFPADFISEAIDQTRGWFYSQLAISTLLFSEAKQYPHPFKNCIVLGLMLGEDGQKMSKSLRNYREPREIFDKYGADALRWYFYANQTPWTSIRYSEQAIRDSMPEFLIRLWNVVSFFEVYRKIDRFEPQNEVNFDATGSDIGELSATLFETAKTGRFPWRSVGERNELDRWILSELNRTIATTIDRMDSYDHYTACAAINLFVDSLSNWYVRRSRDRFWSSEIDANKADAYWTLYESLLTVAKLIAPFVPFISDRIWQTLAIDLFGDHARESVHLCDYPAVKSELIDESLSRKMELVREVVSLGRNARMAAKLKVRQPLSAVTIVLPDPAMKEELTAQSALIEEELNVKAVCLTDQGDEYISYSVVPDFKKLGPKLGASLPKVKVALTNCDGGQLLQEMEQTGKIVLAIGEGTVELLSDEVQIRLQAKDGFAAAQGKNCVVVLSTELTDELLAQGRARELVRLIQDLRKEAQCDYTDRITIFLATDSPEIRESATTYSETICNETLTGRLELIAADTIPDNSESATLSKAKIDSQDVIVYLFLHYRCL